MARIKRTRIFRQVLHNSAVHSLLIGYVLFFLVQALLIMLFEPGMSHFGDAMWYCFVSATTIGFGDFTAVSLLGRVLTVFLYIYTVVVIAIITSITTHYFIEVAKARENDSVMEFFDSLEHLPELSKEELTDLSNRVIAHRKNN